MNAIMKLTAAALGAMSIAGGVAVAQSASTSDTDGRDQTANYGTPPGAPLKRDGSLSADPQAPAAVSDAATDSSSTTRTTTRSTTLDNPPAGNDAPVAATPAPDASASTMDTQGSTPQPRADRN